VIPVLRPIHRVREYVQSPENCYVAGRGWLSFALRRSTTGIVLWGAPQADDVSQLLEVFPLEGSPISRRRPRFIDARRLDTAREDAVLSFARFGEAAALRLAPIVARLAVVHSGGLSQYLVAGLMNLVSAPYELSAFLDPVDALAWLGHDAAPRLAAELDELQARAVGATPLLRDLRAILAADLRGADVVAAAKTLGHSVRNLQRKLHAQATSFQHELNSCRVEAAKKLLVETELPIGDIAGDVGTTSQHFAEVFRIRTGQTPRQWREAH
jgi:AraC-like DNA-binding protein